MQHFSDVLKILEGGLRFNAQTIVNYAKALKEKLEADGEHQQARLLQAKLDGASPTLTAYNASIAPALPVDQDAGYRTYPTLEPSANRPHGREMQH